ncbi:hypothetical protein SAMN05421770_101189 [Granulicella rosea]|uniref:Probable membrane transporter protein n=1 Tax=Granulicella rosea TaxID=474952 RepID=A0A239CYG4_9BACT|nr:sulfite exporter TauE/SafE family protein [Granulicella rosea]SNS25140.1 hypothetical protein SAMN05421770_101189 [Granulicella rosea]
MHDALGYVIGFLIAIVIALTGVGAGVITAPLLILFLHVPIEIAVSTALAYSAIVKLIVVPAQVVRKQVNYKVLGWMLLGGLPGVILGSIFFKRIAATGPKAALSFALGAIIIFTSGWHLFRHFRPAGINRPKRDRSKWVGLLMFPIGAEVGFSSSGAGALGTVALMSMTDLTAPQVVGTDLAFGLAIALVGTGVHMINGHYAADLLLHMAVGGVIGGIVGSGAAPKIPNRTLRLALSVWLMVIGGQFCWQAATTPAKPAPSNVAHHAPASHAATTITPLQAQTQVKAQTSVTR